MDEAIASYAVDELHIILATRMVPPASLDGVNYSVFMGVEFRSKLMFAATRLSAFVLFSLILSACLGGEESPTVATWDAEFLTVPAEQFSVDNVDCITEEVDGEQRWSIAGDFTNENGDSSVDHHHVVTMRFDTEDLFPAVVEFESTVVPALRLSESHSFRFPIRSGSDFEDPETSLSSCEITHALQKR